MTSKAARYPLPQLTLPDHFFSNIAFTSSVNPSFHASAPLEGFQPSALPTEASVCELLDKPSSTLNGSFQGAGHSFVASSRLTDLTSEVSIAPALWAASATPAANSPQVCRAVPENMMARLPVGRSAPFDSIWLRRTIL
jgi:hypothetical protein